MAIGRPKLTLAEVVEAAVERNAAIVKLRPLGELHSKGLVTAYYTCGHTDTLSVWRLMYGTSTCRKCQPANLTKWVVQERRRQLFPGDRVLEFTDGRSPVLYECAAGHRWYASARARHKCKKCSDLGRRITFEQYLGYLRNTTTICLSKRVSPFELGSSELRFRCSVCSHMWKTSADSARQYKFSCPSCAKQRFKSNTKEKYAKRLKRVLESKGNTIQLGEYTGALSRVDVICKICGHAWSPRAGSLLHSGCPICTSNHSAPSIRWLDECQKLLRLRIQHAENLGEFKIPGTRYRADGYNRRFNLVFEFLGDYWHGHKSAIAGGAERTGFLKQRRAKTLERFNKLLSLGYAIAYIWEVDYNGGYSYTLVSSDLDRLPKQLIANAEKHITKSRIRNV